MTTYTTKEIKEKFGISKKTSMIDASVVLRLVEKIRRNTWVIVGRRCACNEGMLWLEKGGAFCGNCGGSFLAIKTTKRINKGEKF